MSLFCDETSKEIEYGKTLFAGTRDDVDFFCALSLEALGRIPNLEKSKNPRKITDEGVNIHLGHSKENVVAGFAIGTYSLRHLRLGKFIFSISKETAEKYLPNHYKRYPNRAIFVS